VIVEDTMGPDWERLECPNDATGGSTERETWPLSGGTFKLLLSGDVEFRPDNARLIYMYIGDV
jgi:hypothetical protein